MSTHFACPAPRPFSIFPVEARACEPYLLLLVAAGPVLSASFHSLSYALAMLRSQLGEDTPSYSALRLLPRNLADLLRLSFGREVELYRTVRLGRRIVGRSADGVEALRLACEYFAASDT